MRKAFELLVRLIALPFVFAVLLIGKMAQVVTATWFFLLYGGEWISHIKEDRVTMYEIYMELKSQREREDK